MNGTPLDELQWKSPEWIQSFGLRTDNVLDYFSESPFFDKTSNNYVIKMQRQFSQLPGESDGSNIPPPPVPANDNDDALVLPTGENGGSIRSEFQYMDAMRQDIMNKYPLHAAMERELMKLNGIEYVLVAVREPDFWVIRKQQRNNGNQPGQFRFEIIKDYYIIGANVYQSPTIYKVIKNRLMSTSLHLSKTIENIYKLTHFEPSQGVQFKQRQQDESTPGNKTIPQTSRTNGPTPSTINSTNMMNTIGNTVSNMNSTTQASPYDSVHREIITGEMMDKLLTTSIKSEPEYI
ncbi:mediator of RNA polymerase II transcription subunit 6 [Monosporozyma servazzii]